MATTHTTAGSTKTYTAQSVCVQYVLIAGVTCLYHMTRRSRRAACGRECGVSHVARCSVSLCVTTRTNAMGENPMSKMVIYGNNELHDRSKVRCYGGFQQNLYGPECMCTQCVGQECGHSNIFSAPTEIHAVWWLVSCPTCGSPTCQHARDHERKCKGPSTRERDR